MNTHISAKKPSIPLTGQVRAPGDKSISHRALIMGALASGVSEITGLLEGEDILATAEAMRAFGANIERIATGHWRITGCGADGFTTPAAPIDFGNAGTGARLIMGAAAPFNLGIDYQGDESLSSRPMGRVLTPLRDMGVDFKTKNDKLPLSQIKRGRRPADGALAPISFTPEHASAQVKSCILLAGLGTKGTTEVYEKRLTRDHTENMLEAFGVKPARKTVGEGQKVSVSGPAALTAANINVPGDPSSAAFLIAAALMVPGSDIVIENVMMNPTRTGLFEVLTEMGAFIRTDNFKRSGGETIADIHVKHSKLFGIDVPAARVPSMVDEYPVLAVIAASAKGTTRLHGLAELRVKESDRLSATQQLLALNGVDAGIDGDSLIIHGGPVAGGGLVPTHHDHRIAMSALILGLGAESPVSIDDASMINTSFPTFFELMDAIGAPMEAPL